MQTWYPSETQQTRPCVFLSVILNKFYDRVQTLSKMSAKIIEINFALSVISEILVWLYDKTILQCLSHFISVA